MHYILAAPIFGAKHLLGLLYVIVLVVVGVILLKKKKSKKEVLLFIILFYVFELLKIGYMIVRDGSYPMHHLPFHLCSMPLYIWPILYFVKENSKLEEYVLATAFVTVLGGALAALIMPTTIIGNEVSWLPLGPNYLPIISFTYHAIMILSSIYLLTSGKYKPRMIDGLRVMPFTFGLMSIAMIFNVLLDRDYMLLNYGNGSPLRFVYDNAGPLAYTLTMIVVGLLVIGFISVVSTLIYKLVKREEGIV